MQNVHAMRPEVRDEYAAVAARLAGDATFMTRLERYYTELRDPLVALYGHDPRFAPQLAALLDAMAATARDRDPELRRLDHEREITPDWLHREQAVGYVCYADRFGGTLQGVRERLPYLRELGVTYLHLMPLLAARPEPNDGGYAVADHERVEPALGTMDDLRALAADLRAHGMALCVDVVLNHTAREHAWAQSAVAGDAGKLAYYRTFPDRAEPDAYERTLPEVFPDIAPGSFSWVPELGRWVWTTFNDYQWDLDYTNPEVFRAMAEVVLGLAAAGDRRAAPRRGAVPVEAHGHGLPEPARGPPAAAGAARGRADRRAGRRLQGRGDRRAGAARHLPRHGPPRGQGVRSRLQQRAHGAALEHARLRAGGADDARARRACRRRRPAPAG